MSENQVENAMRLDLLSLRNDLLAIQNKILAAKGKYRVKSNESLDLQEIFNKIDDVYDYTRRKSLNYGLTSGAVR